jgi:hypothetical protein
MAEEAGGDEIVPRKRLCVSRTCIAFASIFAWRERHGETQNGSLLPVFGIGLSGGFIRSFRNE